MTTFVLVHGAFHGGWCWARTAPLLREAGHSVFTPTQTGLGERAHLLHAGITLGTFVDDVVGVIESEELEDVVLVGHSFGGYAITGVAARMPGRVRHLIYLDAVVPVPGKAPLDLSPPEVAAERRASAAASGGLAVAVPAPEVFGVPAGADADWVRRRTTPHPFGSMDSALTFAGEPGNGRPCTYVACTDPQYMGLAWAWERARSMEGWAWRELRAGHDCMVTAPEATAALLMEIGG